MQTQRGGCPRGIARKTATQRFAVAEQKAESGTARPAERGTPFFYADEGLFRDAEFVRHVVLRQPEFGAQKAQRAVAGGDQFAPVRFSPLLPTLSDNYIV